MERADVVHVWVDVGVRRVKGRLGPHGGVPLGRDPDEGDVGESRTARHPRRPAETQGKENIFKEHGYIKCYQLKIQLTAVNVCDCCEQSF